MTLEQRAEELSEIGLAAIQKAESNVALHFVAVHLLLIKMIGRMYGQKAALSVHNLVDSIHKADSLKVGTS